VVAADAVAQFRQEIIASLAVVAEATIPLNDGFPARFVIFRDGIGGTPIAIIVGQPDFAQPVSVRLHSACLTGDVFGSRRCDCGDQLRIALPQLEQHGGGIILYLEQEGRGLGLANKIRGSTPSMPTPCSASTTTSAITASRCACCRCSAARGCGC
jgi:GTP cyclohydrolase II